VDKKSIDKTGQTGAGLRNFDFLFLIFNLRYALDMD
jgi:hypothetical protein